MARAAHEIRAALSIASVAGLAGLVAFSLGASFDDARAEVVDPTVAKAIAVGDAAAWATDRGAASRDGRVASLPRAPKPRWSRGLGGQILRPPVVDAKGNVILVVSGVVSGGVSGGGSAPGGTISALVELAAKDGSDLAVTKLVTPQGNPEPGLEALAPQQPDHAGSAPIVLANGTRVVLTSRGWAIGVAPGGAVIFRTRIAGELASVGNAALAPLPNGGFLAVRKPELVELDAHGAIVDRTRLDAQPTVVVRENGDALVVTPGGELFSWRAHRVPRSIGQLGDGKASSLCTGGLVLDERTGPGGKKHARAVCAASTFVEQLDLSTGTRRVLLSRQAFAGALPFETAPAVAEGGAVALVLAGGWLVGLDPTGAERAPVELPGTAVVPLGGLGGKDAGTVAYATAHGEVAPLLAKDGAVAWGSSDGIAVLAHDAAAPVRVARCGGSSTSTVAGLASAGPGTLVVACTDGHVELLADSKP